MGPREDTELRISKRRSLCVHRAVRSTATVRNANRIGRRMAGGRANVNGFLLGRNNGEGHRVADVRVFYDVTETEVEILAIVHKDEAQAWLDEEGTPTESGGAR